MTDQPKPTGPSLRKRVLLTLFLILPFLILALLMWVIVFQLQKQGKVLGESSRSSTPVSTNGTRPIGVVVPTCGNIRPSMYLEQAESIAALMRELTGVDTAP